MNIFNAFYSVIIILVALYSIARGFREGITHRMASLMGLAFGAVAARVLAPQFTSYFEWSARFSQATEFTDFTINLVSSVVVYSIVYALFCLMAPIFRIIFSIFEVGILNRILGAFFILFKNILWVSIALNLLLCFSSRSGLLYYESSNDGNLVGAVMDLTALTLGCNGAQDFALFHQLKEAKTISYNTFRNFKGPDNVILIRKVSYASSESAIIVDFKV